MKSLAQIITEGGNISNLERCYRNFTNMVKTYRPDVDPSKIGVYRTSRGNWRVFDENGRKICLVSKNILNNDIIDAYNLRILNDIDKLYINFTEIINSYKPNTNMKKISIKKSNDSDWEVYGEYGKKICNVSNNILTKNVIRDYEINVIE